MLLIFGKLGEQEMEEERTPEPESERRVTGGTTSETTSRPTGMENPTSEGGSAPGSDTPARESPLSGGTGPTGTTGAPVEGDVSRFHARRRRKQLIPIKISDAHLGSTLGNYKDKNKK